MDNNNIPVEKLKGPKVQELSLMARKIQQKDHEWLTNSVNTNPRLLVTDMDTPTIVQEGFRYNALHVAARWDNEAAAKFILSSVSNQTFLKRIYTEDSEPVHKRRLKFLTDMYLNTPDKGASETPLHFACKFNSYKVVKILTSHPMCNLTSKNRYEETPYDLIGTRGGQDQVIIDKIKECFTDIYIVPIWRDPTNSVQPSVGKPIVPKHLGINIPRYFTENIPDIDVFLYEIHTDPLAKPKSEIEKEIRAFAGPTSLEKAEKLFNFLKKSGCGAQRPLMITTSQNNKEQLKLTPTNKTPPSGFFKSPFSIILSPLSPFMSPKNPSNRLRENNNQINKSPFSHSPSLMTPNRPTPEEMTIRVRDIEKGIEILGRRFTKRFDIPWFEYWEFKKNFINFSDPIALQEFDTFLEEKELEHALKKTLKEAQELDGAKDLDNTLGSLYEKFESLKLEVDSFTTEEDLKENSINNSFSTTPIKSLNICKGELTSEVRKEILGKEDAQLKLLFDMLKTVIPLLEYSSISSWFQIEEQPKTSKRTIKPKRLELDFD